MATTYQPSQWLMPENSNTDKVGNYSFEFDGVADYIDFDSSLNLGTVSTLSVWIKRNATGSGTECIFGEDSYAFDYILSTDDIADIFNDTSTGKTADLSLMATPPILWYRMGD